MNIETNSRNCIKNIKIKKYKENIKKNGKHRKKVNTTTFMITEHETKRIYKVMITEDETDEKNR